VGEVTLSLRGISKVFPGVKALDGVELELHAGECLGLLGQNGAGKSTLVKIVSGAQTPDTGTIALGGEPVRFTTPRDAEAAGVFTVYQELSLVPGLSVAENVFMSDLPRRGGVVRWGHVVRSARETLRSIGFDFDVTKPVRSLPVGQRQAVEIAKAVHHDPRVLLLDEPTDTLGRPDVEKLFEVVRGLKRRGVSILFISHRLDEVYEICDRVCVLRDGRRVTTRPTSEMSADDAVRAMVGDRLTDGLVGQVSAGRSRRRINTARVPADGTPMLEVRSLSDEGLLRDVSLKVMPGEAVAVAGLIGSGQSELAGSLFGSRRSTGEIRVQGRRIAIRSPRAAIRAGLGLVPEDRKSQGLVLDMPLAPNVSMASLRRVAPLGVLRRRKEEQLAQETIRKLAVKATHSGQRAGTLSGGNQQKVVFGKWLAADAKVMILCEPTRGVDVAAKEEIYGAIRDYLARGASTLVLTSEIDEALLCDRIYVLARGRIVGELPHDETDHGRLVSLLR
jgi:ribose transport system ATP-binding protein